MRRDDWKFDSYQTMTMKIFAEGEMLVTGTGEVIIDEVLPRMRALLVQPDAYITVEFDPKELPCPPCVGDGSEELDWELFFRHAHDHKKSQDEELKLKITWKVNSARTVIWSVLVPG